MFKDCSQSSCHSWMVDWLVVGLLGSLTFEQIDCFTAPSYELVIPVYEVGEAVYWADSESFDLGSQRKLQHDRSQIVG